MEKTSKNLMEKKLYPMRNNDKSCTGNRSPSFVLPKMTDRSERNTTIRWQ